MGASTASAIHTQEGSLVVHFIRCHLGESVIRGGCHLRRVLYSYTLPSVIWGGLFNRTLYQMSFWGGFFNRTHYHVLYGEVSLVVHFTRCHWGLWGGNVIASMSACLNSGRVFKSRSKQSYFLNLGWKRVGWGGGSSSRVIRPTLVIKKCGGK